MNKNNIIMYLFATILLVVTVILFMILLYKINSVQEESARNLNEYNDKQSAKIEALLADMKRERAILQSWSSSQPLNRSSDEQIDIDNNTIDIPKDNSAEKGSADFFEQQEMQWEQDQKNRQYLQILFSNEDVDSQWANSKEEVISLEMSNNMQKTLNGQKVNYIVDSIQCKSTMCYVKTTSRGDWDVDNFMIMRSLEDAMPHCEGAGIPICDAP